MPVCVVCSSEDFELLHGLYYCNECSTQSQDIREVELDTDFAHASWQVRSISDKKKCRVKKVKEKDEVWLTVEAFNVIIHKQAQALVELGAHPSFMDMVFRLWSTYLKHCEQAFVTRRINWRPKLITQTRMRDIQIAMGKEVGHTKLHVTAAGFSVVKSKSAMRRLQTLRKQNQRKKELRRKKNMLKEAAEAAPKTSDGAAEKAPGMSDLLDTILPPMPPEEDLQMKEKRNWKRIKLKDETEDETPKKKDVAPDKDLNEEVVDEPAQMPKHKRIRNSWKNMLSTMAMQNFKRNKNRFQCNTFIMDRIDLTTVLAICCLALRINRETILLSDVIRWVKGARIPFMKAWTTLPSHWRLFSSDCIVFSSKEPPKANTLQKCLTNVHRQLSLSKKLPMLSTQYVVARYVADLNLPHELVSYVNGFLDVLPLIQTSRVTFIEYDAAFYILYVLKYLFGLDDETEKQLSEQAKKANQKCHKTGVQYFVWSDWAADMAYIQTYQKTMDIFSSQFSAKDCADSEVFQETISFFPGVQLKAERCCNLFKKQRSAFHKSFSQLGLQPCSDKIILEPANSFPIKSILRKKVRKLGKEDTDYSFHRIHNARCPRSWSHKGSHGVNRQNFPKSFVLVFDLFHELLGIGFAQFIARMERFERRVADFEKKTCDLQEETNDRSDDENGSRKYL